jgi:SAM-dependent methyltransferase
MHELVQDYYGKQLQSTADLKTSACCDASSMPAWLKPLLSNVHDEVMMRYYGCGLVCPPKLQGCQILDLGSGSGRDVYVLAQMAGASGHVLGVDMTREQLDVATSTLDWHAERFGYANVSFKEGFIERLDALGLEDERFDVIVSNCVINLSPDKDAVLREAYRLLKTGGELYFSDIYADRRVPAEMVADPLLYGECLSGALYWNDFLSLAKKHGFADPRLVEDLPIEITDPALKAKCGNVKFYSATYRLFKLPELEPDCEEYGQAVIYHGTVSECPDVFVLDKHHSIETGKVFSVCGNTWRMLHDTRFREHFTFIGDFSRHYGIFEGCGKTLPYNSSAAASNAGGACC